MRIIEIGDIRDTGLRDHTGAPIKNPGIVIEATREELANIPWNPLFSEVGLVNAKSGMLYIPQDGKDNSK